MDQQPPRSRVPPAGWLDAITEGEADLAAGRTIPASALLDELRAANDRMATGRGTKRSDAP